MLEYSRIRVLQRENIKLRRGYVFILAILLLSILFNAYLMIQLEKQHEASQELVQAVDEYIKTVELYKTTVRLNYSNSKSVQAVQTQNIEIEPIEFIITGYCPCIKCCGKADGITKSGVKAKSNRTIAMDKKYPMGTKVKIEGLEEIEFIKEDIGGAIKDNKIDIFFNTHQEALDFGRQTRKVWILTPEVLELAQLNN